MIDALFNNTNYQVSKKMLDAAMLRHEAIAANLANLETPGYRRVDLAPSFNAELKQAISTGSTSVIDSLQPTLAVDTLAQPQGRDGNTVQLETELANLQQNTMEHSLHTQLISSSLLRLRLAITGRSA